MKQLSDPAKRIVAEDRLEGPPGYVEVETHTSQSCINSGTKKLLVAGENSLEQNSLPTEICNKGCKEKKSGPWVVVR